MRGEEGVGLKEVALGTKTVDVESLLFPLFLYLVEGEREGWGVEEVSELRGECEGLKGMA